MAENDRMHFQTLATKTIASGLRKSAVVKQNMEAADGTEFLLPSNSIPQMKKVITMLIITHVFRIILFTKLIYTFIPPNILV